MSVQSDGGMTILVIDDHPLVRDALCANLAVAGYADEQVLNADSLTQALTFIRETTPDLVLLDLELGDSSGLEGLARIQAVAPDIPVMIVSSHDDPALFAKARALGARGFMPKNESGDAIANAVQTILDGGAAFPEATDHLSDDQDSPLQRLTSLTPAQRRVTDYLGEGLLNKQIAYEMGISEATVKAHMTAIFRKLGVSNRTQALLVLNDALKA